MNQRHGIILTSAFAVLAVGASVAGADQAAPVSGLQPAVVAGNKEFTAKFSAMVSASPQMSLALLTLKPTTQAAMGPLAPHKPAQYTEGCATGQGPQPVPQALAAIAPSFASKVTLRDRLKAPVAAADKKPQLVKGWYASASISAPGAAAKGVASDKQSQAIAVPVATLGGPKFGEFKY